MAFVHALTLAAKFATRMGDATLSSKYTSVKNEIEATLDSHWTGTFMKESDNREKDAAVLHAFVSFP